LARAVESGYVYVQIGELDEFRPGPITRCDFKVPRACGSVSLRIGLFGGTVACTDALNADRLTASFPDASSQRTGIGEVDLVNNGGG
jgi:hypothetical protein